jgi:hypothetical protein
MTTQTYRPDHLWGDPTRGAGRIDLLALALVFLSGAFAMLVRAL